MKKNKKTPGPRTLVPDCGYFSSVLIIHECLCVCASVCACENVKSDFYTKLKKLDLPERMKTVSSLIMQVTTSLRRFGLLFVYMYHVDYTFTHAPI